MVCSSPAFAFAFASYKKRALPPTCSISITTCTLVVMSSTSAMYINKHKERIEEKIQRAMADMNKCLHIMPLAYFSIYICQRRPRHRID
ncbi:hypothetical protein BRADI_3g13565v3 [Brachypodium distachyon]|uniref:Uncharacterized protein n=1 Tax=Brachypodium distachyon TaxID=15368 RepID=A0A2K2CWW6_BRADI|nr:hypothetical protein BRADI_3g13565v3 [Brachypodium distachyon]